MNLRIQLITLWSEWRRSRSLSCSLRSLRSPRSSRVSGAATAAAATVSRPGRLSAAGPWVVSSCSSSDISALPDSDTASFSFSCLSINKKHSDGMCTQQTPYFNGPTSIFWAAPTRCEVSFKSKSMMGCCNEEHDLSLAAADLTAAGAAVSAGGSSSKLIAAGCAAVSSAMRSVWALDTLPRYWNSLHRH